MRPEGQNEHPLRVLSNHTNQRLMESGRKLRAPSSKRACLIESTRCVSQTTWIFGGLGPLAGCSLRPNSSFSPACLRHRRERSFTCMPLERSHGLTGSPYLAHAESLPGFRNKLVIPRGVLECVFFFFRAYGSHNEAQRRSLLFTQRSRSIASRDPLQALAPNTTHSAIGPAMQTIKRAQTNINQLASKRKKHRHTSTSTPRHTDTTTHRHRDTETQRHRDTETERHRDTETQRHRDRETQRHRDTETQRHRDTETQRHRDTETQRHRDTETQRHTDTQRHRHTDTQTHRHTDTQTHRHTDTQTHRHTDTQTHRHTDTQTQRHTDTQTHRHTDTQTHRHTNTQTRKHTNTQTRKHANTQTHKHTRAHTQRLAHTRTHAQRGNHANTKAHTQAQVTYRHKTKTAGRRHPDTRAATPSTHNANQDT